MKQQAGTSNLRERKQAVDRFQQIVREQEPFIYLVNRNSLVAVSPRLMNAQPAILFPQTFWRAEWMQLQPR
jgi:ABC-type transport system substrate-binding protein